MTQNQSRIRSVAECYIHYGRFLVLRFGLAQCYSAGTQHSQSTVVNGQVYGAK